MNVLRSDITRRSFIQAAAPLLLSTRALVAAQTVTERGQFSEEDVPLARARLLELVNEERAAAGLSSLQLDEMASRIASEHAQDMAKNDFLGHWGSDGRKPYQRYSLAGGTDAVLENVSSDDEIQSVTPNAVLGSLREMHLTMFFETAPTDGHRQTILSHQSTHVGLGIALQGRHLRLDELFLARYLQIDPLPRRMKTNAGLLLAGKLLDPKNKFVGVDLFYEPLPTAPTIEWLRAPRSYGMPEEHETLLPRLPPLYSYPDGGKPVIDLLPGGRFSVRVNLSKKPGINTMMAWVKKGENGIPFPASHISIWVE